MTTLNEEASIDPCLRRILPFVEDGEILVVDGGRDRTGLIVQALAKEFPQIRYIRNENDRGKGHAVHVGIAAARADVLLQIDADLQFLPEEIPRLVQPIIDDQADLVLGSRFMPGSVCRPGSTTPLRSFGNWTTSLYASFLCAHRMTDVLAGMKAWRRGVIETIALRCENCSYDAELPLKTVLHGFRVLDVPVTTDARFGGHSAIHVVRDGMKILTDMTLMRLGCR